MVGALNYESDVADIEDSFFQTMQAFNFYNGTEIIQKVHSFIIMLSQNKHNLGKSRQAI